MDERKKTGELSRSLTNCLRVNYCVITFFGRGDYLQIRNENGEPWYGLYCGELSGKTVAVTGKFAIVKFRSDFANQSRGFLIHFLPVLSSE